MTNKRYKVCVYAICKNESQFVDRFMDSALEADKVVVLDTGSTDQTVEKLKARGALVKTEIISPWRFDTARNKSLDLVPEDIDICVCIDLDEVFEPGWCELLVNAWDERTKLVNYRYTWSFNPDGSEGVVFWIEKIHARHGFKWVHPVHEVLVYTGSEKPIAKHVEHIQVNHYPDNTKPRSQYLPLLELSVKEDPNDDRNMHYLGREYMYAGMWAQAIITLQKHLSLPKATWKDERCASMRYISKCYNALNHPDLAEAWLFKAIAEAPYLREPYMDAANLYYSHSNWLGTIFMIEKALLITSRSVSYINEPSSWGSSPYDLGSIAYFHLGLYEKSLRYAKQAAFISPSNKRLTDNVTFIEHYILQHLDEKKEK